MATRKARPVHFEAYQEGPDSVIPEDCATVFSSWPSGIIKAPLHAEGVVGKELCRRRESVWKFCFLGALMPRCSKEAVWRTLFGQEDFHCFWSLPICFKFHNPSPGSEKPRTRGRDRKPGRQEPLDQLPCQ